MRRNRSFEIQLNRIDVGDIVVAAQTANEEEERHSQQNHSTRTHFVTKKKRQRHVCSSQIVVILYRLVRMFPKEDYAGEIEVLLSEEAIRILLLSA